MSTASGLIQSLRTEILKEGEAGGVTKLTEDEQCRVCSILCTGKQGPLNWREKSDLTVLPFDSNNLKLN